MYVDGESTLEILYEQCFNNPSGNQRSIGTSYHPFDWIYWRDNMANRANTTIGEDWRRRTLRFSLNEFQGFRVTISVQRNYWKTRSQRIAGSSVNSLRNAEAPGRRKNNNPKEQQVGSAGMRVGLRTKRDLPGLKVMVEERVQVEINSEYLEQIVMIGSTLSKEGRNKLCHLLQHNLDIFSWKPTDMTGVPRHITEHRLNI
nr:reverse transcriptase domain-containing protein [Tanacetum cinerariifolium]